MTKHFSDVRTLPANSREKSGTFAQHFVKHFPTSDTTNQIYRKNIEFYILTILDPIVSVKMFRTCTCCLCSSEHLRILEYSNKRNIKLMNRRSEIHGRCKHKPKFHRFGTDDSIMCENVNLTDRIKISLTNNNFGTESPCRLMENNPIMDNDICQFITV